MTKFKTPAKIQVEAIECGAVSFWVVLGFYNKWITTEEARSAVNITKDGSTALNIATALRANNFESEGFQPSINDLTSPNPECRFPCIAWVNKQHWVVLEKFDGQNLLISDPAKGHRVARPIDFKKEYSGLVISAWPTSDFKPSGAKPNPLNDVLDLLKDHKLDLLLYVLIGFAATIPVIAVSTFVGYFADTLLEQTDLSNSYVWLLTLLVGIAFLFSYLQSIIMRRLHMSILAQLVERTFEKLISLPLTFYPLRDLGEISQRITLNVSLSKILTGPIADSVVGVMTMVIYLIIMLSYNWMLGLVVLSLGIIIFYALISVASSLSQLSQKSSMSTGKQTSNVLYITNNFNSVKSNGQEVSLFQQWSDNFTDSQNINKTKGLIQKRNAATTSFLNQLSDYIIVILSGLFILMGKLSIGEFLSFRIIARSFLSPINTLSGVNAQFSNAVGDINRLKDLWDAEEDQSTLNEYKEINEFKPEKLKLLKDSENRILSDPKIQVNGLNYRFSPISDSIFNSLTLSLNEGEVISLTGPSGSGKTILLQCLSGIIESEYEEFTISDIPLKSVSPNALKTSISYMSQSKYIFNGSVLENIKVFDSSINTSLIQKTIKFYDLGEFLVDLPQGLDTIISSSSSISDTTKTVIHILRTLIRTPRVLLMDDILTSFDREKAITLISKISRVTPIFIFASKDPNLISLASRSLILRNGNLIEAETSQLISKLN